MAEVGKIQRVVIDELIPYENNAKRHSDKQLEKLSASIKEFGFISPVLIDKGFNIIAGHGRVEAAKMCGLADVPCVFVEGLTEAQRRAYILADNKLSEFGEWDIEAVHEELEELGELDLGDYDITSLEFPELPEIDLTTYYGDERERTNNTYNLDIAHESELSGSFWEMPVIKNDGFIPDKLIGFNYAKTSKDKKCGIHFFLDDYQFERVWNDTKKYASILSEYECILSPDFSLYMDMPMPMKIWNIYRSRQVGAYYQSCGIKVIPTISWAEPETYCFCFEGIPQKSIVAVSTIGVKEDKKALDIWNDGMQKMIEVIEPSCILIYGGRLDFDFGDIDVRYYSNDVLDRWKGNDD